MHALLLLFQPDVLSRLAPPPPHSSWHSCCTPRIVYHILLSLSYPETVSRGCAPGVPVSVRGNTSCGCGNGLHDFRQLEAAARKLPEGSRPVTPLSFLCGSPLTHAFSEIDQAPLSKGLLNTSPSVWPPIFLFFPGSTSWAHASMQASTHRLLDQLFWRCLGYGDCLGCTLQTR